MALLRRKEIANMPDKDLRDKLKDLRTELIRLNAQRSTRQNVGKVGEIKRTVARLLTKLNRMKKEKQKK